MLESKKYLTLYHIIIKYRFVSVLFLKEAKLNLPPFVPISSIEQYTNTFESLPAITIIPSFKDRSFTETKNKFALIINLGIEKENIVNFVSSNYKLSVLAILILDN